MPTIPFFCDKSLLPQQLPTTAEIDEAQDILSSTAGCKVVAVGEHFVVKYGLQVDLLEGETMLFLQTSSSVPVPRIYALFLYLETKRNYIIMERVHGLTLEKAWLSLSEAEKEITASQLRLITQEMRHLSSPGGFCSYGRRALTDGIFWTAEAEIALAGPFESEQELNRAIITNYLRQGHSKDKADYYARVFDALFQDHKPIFTHGDFQRKNVLLRNNMSRKSEIELVIIDWEFSGWYPSYWEYSRAVFACGR